MKLTEQNIRAMCEEVFKPVYDELVNMGTRMFSSMSNLPEDLPEELMTKTVKDIIKGTADSMIHGIKSSIPTDFEQQLDKKLKEANNGGK